MNRLIIILLLSGWGAVLPANNIRVNAVTLLPQDIVNQTADISFDLSWDNSWRTGTGPKNWDAAWVFVKYRVDEGDWHHASLAGVAAAPDTCTMAVSPDGRGAFAYRKNQGSGSVQYDSLVLVWDYGMDGVAAGANVTVQVFAIEMVYVPTGQFHLGSGDKQGNEFYLDNLFVSDEAYKVLDERALLLAADGSITDIILPTLLANVPTTFPKGYTAFYCMKYEASQRQFVSFYNSLTVAQREGLNISNLDLKILGTPVARNGMAWDEGVMATSAPDIPVSSLSLNQVLAYLDWSGLRPMTEMEFEKACRGTAGTLKREYAWGTTSVSTTAYAVEEPYAINEMVTNIDSLTALKGNGLYSTNNSMGGPLRSGIFAASVGGSTRAFSGGSYYGIMELSGNLSESVVTATNTNGRAFTANHGDGELSATGTSQGLWPSVIGAYGIRGGSFGQPAQAMQVSHRPTNAITTLLSESIGFRGVRSSIFN